MNGTKLRPNGCMDSNQPALPDDTAAPERKVVSRSELRQDQSRVLKQATGKTVVVVTSGSRKEDEDTKYIVDKQYWDEVLGKVQALKLTLAITSDPKLFAQILRAGETVDEDS